MNSLAKNSPARKSKPSAAGMWYTVFIHIPCKGKRILRILYLDCPMGAAGDMLCAALLSLHPAPQDFLDGLNALLAPDVCVSFSQGESYGVGGFRLRVEIGGRTEGEAEEERRKGEVSALLTPTALDARIAAMEIDENAKAGARAVYARLARAQSHVHKKPISAVHFSALGALDALCDILCFSLLVCELAPDAICASPLHAGGGSFRCAGGVFTVPAPATAYLLQGIPYYTSDMQGELLTPTAAALLGHYVSSFCAPPAMQNEKYGIGLGERDFDKPSYVRCILGNA